MGNNLIEKERNIHQNKVDGNKMNTQHIKHKRDLFQLRRIIGNKNMGRLLEREKNLSSVRKKDNKQGLPEKLKFGIENLSGMQMDDVKVHYNSSEPKKIDAHAFATGADIHLGEGQEKFLSHEAWHIVQQRQGKVQPTKRVNNKLINDDDKLEKEASQFGKRAEMIGSIGRPIFKEPHSSPMAPTLKSAPIQRANTRPKKKRKLNNGGYVGVNGSNSQGQLQVDNGSSSQDNSQISNATSKKKKPHLSIMIPSKPNLFYKADKRKKTPLNNLSLDEEGNLQVENVKNPPTQKELQKVRKEQGGQLAKKINSLSDSEIEDLIKEVTRIRKEIEEKTLAYLPKEHREKVEQKLNTDMKADNLRKIIGGTDELTQTKATYHFSKGFIDKMDKGDKKEVLEKFRLEYMHMCSSLRVLTEHVVAPIKYNGKDVGQKHPTKEGLPDVERGDASHSFSDRHRVETQNQVFKAVYNDSNAVPLDLVLSSPLAAGHATITSMMAPLTAENVAGAGRYTEKQLKDQMIAREAIKTSVNILAREMGLETNEEEQSKKGKWRLHKTPTSPRRV